MSKASEWFDTIYPSCPSVATIQAIIDDARAGMVPEAEAREKLYAQVAELLRAKHEAELAKAWEAGRASAQACVKKFCVEPQDCYVDADIAKLQPPGGKPKTCGADLVWMRPGNRPGGLIPCNRPAGHEGAHQALTSELTGGKPK